MNGIYPAWIGPCSTTVTETEKVFIEVPSGAGGGGIFADKYFGRQIKVTASINMDLLPKKRKKPIVKVEYNDRN